MLFGIDLLMNEPGFVNTTMYDKGPLTAHLIAIFLTITLLALCAATLIGQPQTGRRIAAAASFD